ncbi:MAG: hypothetical protein MJ188_02425 [Treponema sp.]|nr:hypothetical protein [Treponema sp.]
MKLSKIIFTSIISILFLSACEISTTPSKGNSQQNNQNPSNPTTPTTPDNPTPPDENQIIADSFFWGNWTRMDNGKNYIFNESYVLYDMQKYPVLSSSLKDDATHEVTVSELGTFVKESDSVIKNNSIPYFRVGGSNLKYNLTLVGMEAIDTNKNIRASISSNLRAVGKSQNYSSFVSETTSDENGIIQLVAPTVNDIQTVTIDTGNELIVVPGLKIENNNSNMGTVAVVEKGLWNFKITGEILDSEKDDGYLYGNNYKQYKLKLTITNIGERYSDTSTIEIKPEDGTNLRIKSNSSNLHLDGTMVSKINPNEGVSYELLVEYGALTEPYIETGINVVIENLDEKNPYVWKDFIPLKFHKGLIPTTIAAYNTAENDSKSLNGFFIYPDGNSKYFSVGHNQAETIYVPTFGYDEHFILSFSGAKTDGSVQETGEMFYTCYLGSTKKKVIDVYTDVATLKYYYNYAEPNNFEYDAFEMEEAFEAYLHTDDIDFFSIKADSPSFYLPNGKYYYAVRYKSMFNDAPETITLENGTKLTSSYTPTLNHKGYYFCGWYINDTDKLANNTILSDNVTLTAKWCALKVPEITLTNDSDISIQYSISSSFNQETQKLETYLNLTAKNVTSDCCWIIDEGTQTTGITKTIDISDWTDRVHQIYLFTQNPDRSASIYVTLPESEPESENQ